RGIWQGGRRPCRRGQLHVTCWATMVTFCLVTLRSLPRFPLLVALLQDPRLRVVFEVHYLRHLSALAQKEPPSVLVADMDMGVGVRTLMQALKARFPGVPVVLLDRAADAARAQRARNLGAAEIGRASCRDSVWVAGGGG